MADARESGSCRQSNRDSAAAAPARSVRLRLPRGRSATVDHIAGILRRQIRQRCDAEVTTGGEGVPTVELAIAPGLGDDGFAIVEGDAGTLRIIGNDERGLLYGVGKFLRSSRCDERGFTPGAWRGTSTPQGSFRGIYAATHYANFYEAAPIDEVQRYIEDLALWGANALIVCFPTWQFTGFDDPLARTSLNRLRSLLKAAKAIGLKLGLTQCANQGFSTAPDQIRAAEYPDDLGRRGHFGINCCPSRPEGREYLITLYGHLFGEFKDIGLDYLVMWPYDEGGCGCAQCWPWGARGFPRMSREVILLARAQFPGLKSILSTWVYDTPPAGEWEGLSQLLAQDSSWVDYVMADSHTDFPRYPLEHGVPGGLPLLNFPEISMWGRSPWGGYGANPLPARLQTLWNQTCGKLSGGMPYSEGIYEDMNKAICLQFYWQPNRTAEDTLEEYLSFEYSPDAAPQLLQAIRLLETTWVERGPDTTKAYELIRRAEKTLTPQARSGWRWRLLYLRAAIDRELFDRQGDLDAPVLKQPFDELVRIYHAENCTFVRPPGISGNQGQSPISSDTA
jgi:hypothetical protein